MTAGPEDLGDRRIELVEAPDGTWEIHDMATGRPIEIGSRQATGMNDEDARELLDVLTRPQAAYEEPEEGWSSPGLDGP